MRPPATARHVGALALVALALATPVLASRVLSSGVPEPPLRLGTDERIDANAFRIATFADGLPYPTAMQELPDGSLLVAVNEAPEGGFIRARGKLVRLVDSDADGVADVNEPIGIVGSLSGNGTAAFMDLPDAIIQMRRLAGLLFLSTRARDHSTITILREPAVIGAPYVRAGSIELHYPLDQLHQTYGLAVRQLGASRSLELYFNVGSRLNAASDATPVRVSGLIEGALQAESIQRVTLVDDGTALTATDVRLIATGLRNAAGLAFQPGTGDLYLQDNGIDRPGDPEEPLNADELNVIPADRLGRDIVDFGFPTDYVEYRTGLHVDHREAPGSGAPGAVAPVVAFQPIDGSEAQGAAEMTFAPPLFPDGLNSGIFIGFHGRYSLAGIANEENPLLYVDPATGAYVEFVSNDSPSVGHLDNVLATRDSLYVADLSHDGGLWTAEATGTIYQITSAALD